MNRVKILVVENETIVALEVQERLRTMGFCVGGISISGETAIKLTERIRPDLVLMDIKLKGIMDGIEAADIIKEKYSIASVFFTALSDDDTLRRIKQSSNQEYVIKPLVEDELKGAIQRLFKSFQTEKSV